MLYFMAQLRQWLSRFLPYSEIDVLQIRLWHVALFEQAEYTVINSLSVGVAAALVRLRNDDFRTGFIETVVSAAANLDWRPALPHVTWKNRRGLLCVSPRL